MNNNQTIIVQIVTIPLNKIGWDKNDLIDCKSLGFSLAPYDNKDGIDDWEPQHLYFITDEPIKKGEWFYHDVVNNIFKATFTDIENINRQYKRNAINYAHKIIASTDKSLKLPTIPLTWIRDVFVPSNDTIKEVELKVNYYCKLGDSLGGCNRNCDCSEETRYLELTPIDEVLITNTPQAKALALAEELLPTLQNAAIDYLKKVKSPALNTSWQQFDIDIFKAGVEWQKKYSDKRWTDEDMKSAWKQAEGKTWDEEHGYYSPDFEEWLTELKQEKFKENE